MTVRAATSWRLSLALAWVVVAGGVAWAQSACLPVPGGGELTVLGVGRVVFFELATDRVRDAATFGGDVCLAIEGADVTFRTQRLEVVGLGVRPRLTSGEVQVAVPGWELAAVSLSSEGDRAELIDVAIVGVDGIGTAERIRLDLVSGRVEAQRLVLLTPSIRLDAVSATLVGDALIAQQPQLSTCDCAPEDAPIRLDAVSARVELGDERVTLTGGVVVAGSLRWPLPSPVTLDEAAFASIGIPIALGRDPDGEAGWLLRGVEREVAPGTRSSWQLTSGAPDRSPSAAFELDAREGAVSLAWDASTERLAVDLNATWPLAAGFSVEARQRFEVGDVEDPVRDTGVRLAWGVSGTGFVGEVGAGAALTGQTLGDAEVIGPRLGLDGRLELAGGTGGAWRPSVRLQGGTTRYPWDDRTQTWALVAPRFVAALGPVRVDVSHQARWVAGRSPFGTRVDRLLGLQRSDGTLTWSFGGADGWRGDARISARYGWDPDPIRPGQPLGTQILSTRLRLNGPLATGRLEAELAVAWAGLIDPRPERDTHARGRLAWTDGEVELGIRSTLGLGADGGWRDVTVFGAAPLPNRDAAWRWRPYLAVDLLAFAGGDGPWLRGHGLDLAWTTCCGTVELGYRVDGDDATTRFEVRLPVRTLDPARLPEDGSP